MTHRRFGQPVQALSQEVENLLVPKPLGGTEVDFQSAGLEQDDVPSILQGCHIAIERLPVVGDDDHAAGGGELLRDLVAQQAWRIGMPTDPLDRLALGQAFEQSYSVSAGIQAVQIVQDDGLVAMTPQRAVEAENRGVTIAPTDGAREGLVDDA